MEIDRRSFSAGLLSIGASPMWSAMAAEPAAAWPGELLGNPFASGITDALQSDIVVAPLRIEGRFIHVPDRPGLGVELDEAAVRSMRLDC
jgi:L-alanine-DL-glutamate epimerase-like enolase superfamily enzyme